MKKCRILTAVLLVLCLTGVLMGCGAKRYKFKPEGTSIFFTDDGRVKEALYDGLEESYLNKEDFEAFVEEEVAKYNEGLNGAAVEMDSFKEDKETGIVSVQLSYKTLQDYMDFNYNAGLVRDVKTADMEELSAAQITLEGDFVKADGSTSVGNTEVQSAEGFALTGTADSAEDVTVYVEGNIQYVSSNITEVEKNCAKVPAGENFTIIYK